MKQNEKKRYDRWKEHTPMDAAMAMTDFSADATDPMGSYTGIPLNPYEKPVQDADDL